MKGTYMILWLFPNFSIIPAKALIKITHIKQKWTTQAFNALALEPNNTFQMSWSHHIHFWTDWKNTKRSAYKV